ncbi:MAG TPA: 3-hydroxyacyl-CoA dehydrogenase NAD-binding domain-containing protein [Myxococcota bacterium]|nr:3-hydroxyacyl-CoA dehydrogenase NAD-binding domain-containing protein [Myxococcota bacterium]
MDIKRIGVVGAGQMGAGIAQVAASAGYSCAVTDIRNDALVTGAKTVEKSLAKLLAKGLIDNKNEIVDRIQWHADMERLRQCDLAIEAVVENEGVKKEVLRALDSVLKEEAIIATNTSSISITRLANATTRPEKFIGMHFMNPVPLMNLVEIIRGHHTKDETVLAIKTVAEKMGKTSTTSHDFPGFIANRILMPMINEAFYALMENVADASDIDLTMKLGCNMPMGPLALADMIGLDTCLAIIEVMHDGLGDDKYRPCPLLRKYVEAGLFGRKTKAGVYSYQTT